jgi:hypothetical protein
MLARVRLLFFLTAGDGEELAHSVTACFASSVFFLLFAFKIYCYIVLFPLPIYLFTYLPIHISLPPTLLPITAYNVTKFPHPSEHSTALLSIPITL